MLFSYVFLFLSEEDISTIKASLYLFKTISQRFFKNKSYEALIKPVIKLVLVATSRVCSNSEILGNKLTEVKDNVTSSLKDTLTYVTTTKIKISLFNVQHRAQGKSEIQVNNIRNIRSNSLCYLRPYY